MPASKSSTGTEFEGTAMEMAQEIRRMAEEQKAARATLFTQFTARIFDEFPDLNRVIIQGYTPGFNDGDPCVHSQETYLNIRGFAEHNEEDEAFRYISNEENPVLSWDARYVLNEGVDGFRFNVNMTPEQLGDVHKAFGAFTQAIEDLYNTDFTLTWERSRDDGKIVFSHERYECGY